MLVREVEDALSTAVELHWYVIRAVAIAATIASRVGWPETRTVGDGRKLWRW